MVFQATILHCKAMLGQGQPNTEFSIERAMEFSSVLKWKFSQIVEKKMLVFTSGIICNWPKYVAYL